MKWRGFWELRSIASRHVCTGHDRRCEPSCRPCFRAKNLHERGRQRPGLTNIETNRRSPASKDRTHFGDVMELTRTQSIVSWLLQIVVAVILFQTLFFKFTGAEESKYIFNPLGLEPWGRIGS